MYKRLISQYLGTNAIDTNVNLAKYGDINQVSFEHFLGPLLLLLVLFYIMKFSVVQGLVWQFSNVQFPLNTYIFTAPH